VSESKAAYVKQNSCCASVDLSDRSEAHSVRCSTVVVDAAAGAGGEEGCASIEGTSVVALGVVRAIESLHSSSKAYSHACSGAAVDTKPSSFNGTSTTAAFVSMAHPHALSNPDTYA